MNQFAMSQQAFASFIEISPATLSSIFNGRTRATLNLVDAIKAKIPEINTDWLLFGEGEMFKETSSQGSVATPPTPSEPEEGEGEAHMPKRSEKTTEANKAPVVAEVKYIDKPQRHIVEIKVYYDDYTYDSFVPAQKKKE